MSESPGLRPLDAEEVNRRASELDDQPYSVEVAADASETESDDSAMSATHVSPGESEADAVFPPEVEGDRAIGGSVEDRAVLREENTGRDH